MSDLSTSRLIRVLHICTILLTARVFIAPLLRHLAGRGYDVAVACSGAEAADGPGLSADRKVAGCPLYPVAITRTIRPLADLRAVWQLYRLIRRLKPDIVHTQTSKAGAVGRLAARLAGGPLGVPTGHALSFPPPLRAPGRWACGSLERGGAGPAGR